MIFFDIIIIIVTLSTDIRVHRAGSQLKMSERQTKAGNQECFENLKNFHNFHNYHNFHSLILSLLTC